jgi:hypothetical protein
VERIALDGRRASRLFQTPQIWSSSPDAASISLTIE